MQNSWRKVEKHIILFEGAADNLFGAIGRNLKKEEFRIQGEFICLKNNPLMGSCEQGNEPPDSIKIWELLG